MTYESMLNSMKKLQEILEHPFIRGKPVLVVATKADLLLIDDSLQLYDIENTFQMEMLARRYGSHIKLCYSHTIMNQMDDGNQSGLLNGFKWLLHYVMVNYDDLNVRLKYDHNIQVSSVIV